MAIMIEQENAVDYDALAREYIQDYLMKSKTQIWPESGFGDTWEPIIAQLERFIAEKHVPPEGMAKIIRADTRLKDLFEDDPVQGGEEEVKGEGPELTFNLPPVNLDNSFFMSVRAQFLAFAKELSPESYEPFLEGAFWWVCSAIAMRRIAIDFSEPMYTNLYIALCAKSTVWKKSTALISAERILKGLGLLHIRHKGSETPESFVHQASGSAIRRDYDDLNSTEQAAIRQELATAGLEGLFIDELGQYLLGTRNANGPMGLWRRIILEWNGCPEDWRKKTKGGGWEIVAKTYLTMVGCIVPDNLNEEDMEALQKDGNIARLLTLTPPDGTVADVVSFGQGYLQTPPELLAAFSGWHQRLKPIVVDVINENEGDNKKSPKYATLWIQPLEETIISLTPEAYQIWHNYRVAIRACIQENDLSSTFAAYYERLPMDLVKMAAMAASFEGKYYIDLTHLAMAYPFIEEARKGIHRLMSQAGYNEEEEDDYEERKAKREKEILSEIREYFKSNKKDFSIPVLLNRRPKLEKISITTLTQTIEDLVKSQFLTKETKEHPVNKKRTTVYKLNT